MMKHLVCTEVVFNCNMALLETQTYSCHGTSTWKKKLCKAKLMYMNLRFGIILVEPSFEFVAKLRSCIHVREIKTASRNSASRLSIPLPLISKVTWNTYTKFSTFHHRGILPTLLSCNRNGSARISARTKITLTEIVLAFPHDSRSTSRQQRLPSRYFTNRLTSTFAHSGLRYCRQRR